MKMTATLPRLFLVSSALCLSRSVWAAPTSAVIAQDNDLSSLQQVVVSAGLASELDGANPSTVFAPTNAAFAAANATHGGLVTKLLSSPAEWSAHLTALVRYHVVKGEPVTLTDGLKIDPMYKRGGPLTSSVLGDGTISLSGSGFEGSKIVPPEIAADNGVVHKVDQVFLPATLRLNMFEASQEIKGFALALPFIVKAGLEQTLRNDLVTLFGPTSTAFGDLEPEFLNKVAKDDEAIRFLFTNHIAAGLWPRKRLTNGAKITMLSGLTYTVSVTSGQIKIGDVPISVFDDLASNGVAHQLNTVLIPSDESTVPKDETDSSPPPVVPAAGSVAAVIVQESDLSSLEIAMQWAGLVQLLSGSGPYTVFGPTDAALATANQEHGGMISKMLDSPEEYKAHLVALVRFHVHSGTLAAASITNGMAIANMLPAQHSKETYVASVDATSGAVSLSGDSFSSSTVVAADVAANNGVVHKVDRVFMPTSLTRNTIAELAAAADFYPGFGNVMALIAKAGLEETLKSDTERITMFAPGDTALAAGGLDNVDVDRLRLILENHMVRGIYHKERLTDGMQLVSMSGRLLKVKVTGAGRFKVYSINNAFIDAADLVSKNGMAHIVDTVLMPSSTDADFVCSVCEPGLALTLPDTSIKIPPGFVDGIDSASCALVDVVVNNSPGQFNQGVCGFLRNLFVTECGCVPAPAAPKNNDGGRSLLRRRG